MIPVGQFCEKHPNKIIIALLGLIFGSFYFSDLFLFSDGAFIALKSYVQYHQTPTGWYPLDVDIRFQRFLPHCLVQFWVYLAGLQKLLSFSEFCRVYAAAYSLTYFIFYSTAVLLFRTVKDKYFALLIIGIIQLPVFIIYTYETSLLVAVLLMVMALIIRRPLSYSIIFFAAALIINMRFIHEFYVFAAIALLIITIDFKKQNIWNLLRPIQVILIITIIISLVSWWQLPAGKYQGQYDQGIWHIFLTVNQFSRIPLLIFATAAMLYFALIFKPYRSWLLAVAAAFCGGFIYSLRDPFADLIIYRIFAFFVICAAIIAYEKFKDKIDINSFIAAILLGTFLNFIFMGTIIHCMRLDRDGIHAALNQQSQIKLIDAGKEYGSFLPLMSIVFSGDHFCQIAINREFFKEHLQPQQNDIKRGLRLLTSGKSYFPFIFYTLDNPSAIFVKSIDGSLLDIKQLPNYQCNPMPNRLLE